MSVIVPSQAPQIVGFVVVAVMEIGGFASVIGPTGGVTQPELSVAIILVYTPAHRPVRVMDPVPLVVRTTGAWGLPPRVYVTV